MLMWLLLIAAVSSTTVSSTETPESENPPLFDVHLAEWALEFSAAAYAENPNGCALKNNATIVYSIRLPCDYLKDECWGLVSLTDSWIVVSFRGTRTKVQLITELIETMSEPKKKLRAGGSVQHYFDVALLAIWKPIHNIVRKLTAKYPDHKILFTGHSLGGALASLASTVFAYRHPAIVEKIHLVTFGQPRVGNWEYAQSHDLLVPKSWRIIHKYDLVAHLPLCASRVWFTRSCIPFFNHAPYHHGTEIWFPDNMTNAATYEVCDGIPKNEDDQCSNSYYLHYGIRDHLYYFEHLVSEYGDAGCVDPPSEVYQRREEEEMELIMNRTG